MSSDDAQPERRPVALATTFARAQAQGPEALLGRVEELFARAAAPDGTGLVLDAHLDGELRAALHPLLEARRDQLPILALEHDSGLVGRPALAALDREESRAALRSGEAILRRAAALGAAHVVLRLGWVDGARRDWTFARDRFLRGTLDAQLGRRLLEARDAAAAVHLDRARGALDRLARLSDGLGVRLLVKNAQRYVELPSARELDVLRSELRGAPLDPLFDLPAAHLGDQMGLAPLGLVEAAFGAGPIVYVGDACGAIAALPPGSGELGASRVREVQARHPAAARVFRPWPALDDEEIAAGLASVLRGG
jgi:hypothetical protein